MTPLDAALARLGHVTLTLLDRPLADRARRATEDPASLEPGEDRRVAEDVDRLAGLLAQAG